MQFLGCIISALIMACLLWNIPYVGPLLAIAGFLGGVTFGGISAMFSGARYRRELRQFEIDEQRHDEMLEAIRNSQRDDDDRVLVKRTVYVDARSIHVHGSDTPGPPKELNRTGDDHSK